MIILNINKAKPPGVACAAANNGQAAITTPVRHNIRLKITFVLIFFLSTKAVIRLMNTGLVAIASDPKPGEMYCIAMM
jgi:hypothetical protein